MPGTSGVASGRGTQFGQLGYGDKEEGGVAAQGLSCDSTFQTSLGYHGRPWTPFAFNGTLAAPCQGSDTAMRDNAVEETYSVIGLLRSGLKKHVGTQ